ncbi:MAG: hypothetical protein ACYDHW_07085 [Syntrophorhabdaceae bacterium]
MKGENLIQITIFADPDLMMDKGISWRDNLLSMKRDMIRHGRKARIEKDPRTKEVALFADDISRPQGQKMRDCTAINVRTME